MATPPLPLDGQSSNSSNKQTIKNNPGVVISKVGRDVYILNGSSQIPNHPKIDQDSSSAEEPLEPTTSIVLENPEGLLIAGVAPGDGLQNRPCEFPSNRLLNELVIDNQTSRVCAECLSAADLL